MTQSRDLDAKADQFARRAAKAKLRTMRNVYRSLEQTCRDLARERARRLAASQAANAN